VPSDLNCVESAIKPQPANTYLEMDLLYMKLY